MRLPLFHRAFVLALAMAFVMSCSDDNTTAPPGPGDTTVDVGDIVTWAGNGHQGHDGEGNTLLNSSFYWPADLEFTPNIGTYLVDFNNHRIRRLRDDGTLELAVGKDLGDGPDAPDIGADLDGPWPGTDCNLNHPTDVFENVNGTLTIMAWHNHKVREWDPTTGMEIVVAGRGANCTGDGGPFEDALMNQPSKGVQAPDGTFYFIDQRNQCVRRVGTDGVITSVVSTPVCSQDIEGDFAGDGGPPADAKISMPTGSNPNLAGGGIALDDAGILYISDTFNHRIRRVDFGANVITTIAGNGVPAYAGDGGPATSASLNTPLDIEIGPDGRLYIADTYNHAIRAVDLTTNVIVTVAGTGQAGFSGDYGPATSAQLNGPWGIAFDQNGDLFIADSSNNRFRRVRMK